MLLAMLFLRFLYVIISAIMMFLSIGFSFVATLDDPKNLTYIFGGIASAIFWFGNIIVLLKAGYSE